MLNRTGMNRTALLLLLFFSWFTLLMPYDGFAFLQEQEPPVKESSLEESSKKDPPAKKSEEKDALQQGIEKYRLGDYEASIRLLDAYASDFRNEQEKRARAYYFLAKNYNAVNPIRVQELLRKSYETDLFIDVEENDGYFRKIVEAVRLDFIQKLPVHLYLEHAENAFELGEYHRAGYYYRVVLRKLPGKTFEKRIRECDAAKVRREEALKLYGEKQYPSAYVIFRELVKFSPRDRKIANAVRELETRFIEPRSASAGNNLLQKNYREAASDLEEVLAFRPGDRESREKLDFCRRSMSVQQESGSNVVVKEGSRLKKKKRKIFTLPVILGAAALGVLLYFLFIKKKDPGADLGSINVQSTPSGAFVWLDGADTGRVTNAVLVDLEPGSHTLKLTLEGYLDYQVNVTVEAGKETLVYAQLNQAPTPHFITSADVVAIPEGGENSFRVKLSEDPRSDVNVVVAYLSGDTDLTIGSGESLVFTSANWDSFQTVTLQAAMDDDTDDGEAVFRLSAPGIPDKDIAARELDSGGVGALFVSPVSGFSASGGVGGPFSPSVKTYILQNTGSRLIQWTAVHNESWVSLSDSEGVLNPGTSTAVTVHIRSSANSLAVGTYNDTVTFTNDTNGIGNASRTVSLTVTE